MTFQVENLKVKLFADGADLDGMLEMNSKSYIKGLTTNPTLMRKAGVMNYEKFAKEVLSHITQKPVSFEVFSDDLEDMKKQALKIASWGDNVFVKIPITNTRGMSTFEVVRFLTHAGVKINLTAVMTAEQVANTLNAFSPDTPSYISIFAGRIADTGRDPIPAMKTILEEISMYPKIELIWASPRELLNVIQANEIGCQIITATSDILKKIALLGRDLTQYSLETVEMFYQDATASDFRI